MYIHELSHFEGHNACMFHSLCNEELETSHVHCCRAAEHIPIIREPEQPIQWTGKIFTYIYPGTVHACQGWLCRLWRKIDNP